jgi:hypothetical protein
MTVVFGEEGQPQVQRVDGGHSLPNHLPVADLLPATLVGPPAYERLQYLVEADPSHRGPAPRDNHQG